MQCYAANMPNDFDDKEKIFLNKRSNKDARKVSSRFSTFLSIFVLLSCLVSHVLAQDQGESADDQAYKVTELPEMQLITGLSNVDKSSAFYTFTVSNNTFSRGDNGIAHLAINAYATSFNSDPDIYISKSQHVTFIEEAEWHSTREGSDTLIINEDEYAIGDTFYVTVKCMNACDYDLKMFYAREFELTNSERTVFRWGGHVTNILKLQVNSTTAVGQTKKFEIAIEPEVDYKYIEAYVSIAQDGNFNVIEDKAVSHMTDKGLNFYMTDDDPNWCTECYVYVIVNMIEDRRIYVTASTMTSNEGIQLLDIDYSLLANAGHVECEAYSIKGSTYDAMFSYSSYQGAADFFLAKRTAPSSIDSSSVVLRTKSTSEQQVLIASQIDREYWGAPLGVYYFCAQAYDALSSSLMVSEKVTNGKITANFDTVYNFFLHKESAQQFKFVKAEMKTERAIIQIDASVYSSGNGDSEDLMIYYKLCVTKDCFFTAEEAIGQGFVERLIMQTSETQANGSDEALEKSIDYTGYILHRSSDCAGTSRCDYVVSVHNPSTLATPRQVSLKVSVKTEETQDITPGMAYINQVQKGQYVNYRILDAQFDLDLIYKVTIDLKTYHGDADLYVSTTDEVKRPNATSYTFASRHKDHLDQVTLTDTVNNWLPDQIYIAVYGELFSEFELTISAEFHPIHDEKLTEATALDDNWSVYGKFADEFGEAFYSYRPWWSAHENKAMVMLADSPLQEVTFYLALDDYPLVYMTDWIDQDEMFVLQPWDEGYRDADGFFGTYYVRVRPRYDLADLLRDGAYSYYFRAFTQPAGYGLTDLYQNVEKVGVAHEGQGAYYRHFLTEKSHTMRLTLYRLSGKGLPVMMIKLANERVYPTASEPISYDFKVEMPSDKYSVDITLDQALRASEGHPDCNLAGYWQDGGNERCTVYATVECGEGEEMCAFKIELELFEQNTAEGDLGVPVTASPALYIPRDQDYVDVSVGFAEHQRLYYPISPDSGDLLIFVNKTASIGQNGRSAVVFRVETDSQQSYKDWTYAWNYAGQYVLRAVQDGALQPSILELPQAALQILCPPDLDCTAQIGIQGLSQDLESHARVRVFNSTNQLKPDTPILGQLAGKGAMKYYWFYSKGAMTSTNWQHTIASGIRTYGADFDLYVSVMDGRYPTVDDFDYRSTNYGADSVFISSDDAIMKHENEDSYDPSVGMIVVVGVLSLQDEEADFSLVMNGPQAVVYDIVEMQTNESIVGQVPLDETRDADNKYMQIYKWYNWGHGDFQLEVAALKGDVKFFFNHVSETEYQENGVSGIGLNSYNSVWDADLSTTVNDRNTDAGLTLRRSDSESFCYNCWYYVTVIVEEPIETEYRVWFSRLNDAGDEMPELVQDSPTPFSLAFGDAVTARILLSATAAFTVNVECFSGDVQLTISADPDNLDESIIWSAISEDAKANVKVASDDANFTIGTWYFVKVTTVSAEPAEGEFTLSQKPTVEQMADKVSKKVQFTYASELVKFSAFRVPTGTSFDSWSFIEVEPLCNHFYPTIYLKKIELSQAPTNIEDLEYPSLVDYDLKFGDDFQTRKNLESELYSVRTFTDSQFAYYTMAIYKNSFGMTDRRKPEFKLTVSSFEVAGGSLIVQASQGAEEKEGALVGQAQRKSLVSEKLEKALEFFNL